MTSFKHLVVLLHIFPVGLCLPPGLEWVTPEQMTMDKYANAIPFPVQAHDPQYNPDDWTFEWVEFLLVSPVYKWVLFLEQPIILKTLGDCVEECKKYSNCAAATWSNPYKFCFFSDFEHGVKESNVGGLEYGTVIYKKVNWADSTCPRPGQSTETDPTTEELLIEEEKATSEMETTATVTTPATTTTTSTTTTAPTTAPTTTTTMTTTTTSTTPTTTAPTTSTPTTASSTTATPTTTTSATTATPSTPISATSTTTTTTKITTSTSTTSTAPTTSATSTPTTTTTTTTSPTTTTTTTTTTTSTISTADNGLPTLFTSLVVCRTESDRESTIEWMLALEAENLCDQPIGMNVCVATDTGSCALEKNYVNGGRAKIGRSENDETLPFYLATASNECGATMRLQSKYNDAEFRMLYTSGDTVAPGFEQMNYWVWDEEYCKK